MKVILMQDVAKLGRRYDVVDVPNGRALNMLIPQGLAKPADKANVANIKSQKDKIDTERAVTAENFAKAVEKLGDSKVTVEVSANKQGHLFEALKETAVAEALAGQGVEVEATQVLISEAIKEVGTHQVSLSNGEERVNFDLEVVAK